MSCHRILPEFLLIIKYYELILKSSDDGIFNFEMVGFCLLSDGVLSGHKASVIGSVFIHWCNLDFLPLRCCWGSSWFGSKFSRIFVQFS